MRKIRIPYILLAAFIAINLYSCLPQQKSISHQQQLSVLDSQLTQHSKKLKELDAKRQAKQDQNEIDDTASDRIKKYIGMATAEIDKLVTQNSILIGTTVVNRDDWVKLKKA